MVAVAYLEQQKQTSEQSAASISLGSKPSCGGAAGQI